ncbi:LysR family transcriptional regulator [Rhodococcus opacus]|uniref:LysR family transcriptional regulator n=1 Tax=Rhodococcus opacus TaxID=37919 RepID=A0AAX3YSM3_RHOOP|nr:LysR family transcriptional regulator [Rhodococcus opacus]MCZ4585974.1 LysR family transcriptional regulator [Rhodococcus opacus]WLF52070.1 LysR family transcriptional regulator [Rhodococcus opacus]
MEISNLNLNLLIHLDALLSHRSVSRAAEHLGLSQPTVSAALARLRRHFGDELLHRVGNSSELTPMASSLRPLVTEAIISAQRVFLNQKVFDPATCRREFTILTSDYWMRTFGPPLSRSMASNAPMASLRFELVRSEDLDRPVNALQKFDGALVPHGVVRGAPHVDLVTTEWCVVVSVDNDRVGESIEIQDLAELPWVIYADRSSSPATTLNAVIIRQLRLSGLDPRIAAAVPTFTAVPDFVVGTDRVAVIHRPEALRLQDHMGLRILDLPVPNVSLTQAFWWHPQVGRDEAHRWLRTLLREVAEQLTASQVGFEPPAADRAL